MTPAAKYIVDGFDFWTIFSILVESGSDDFLKYPAAKQTITRDWSDANGLDVDTSAFYFKERSIALRCAMLADSETDFHSKYQGFIAQWMKPGLHRIEIAEFGMRSFFCIYRDTSAFERFSRVRMQSGQIKIATKFTLNLTEVEPRLNNDNIFIITQDGRFLIT